MRYAIVLLLLVAGCDLFTNDKETPPYFRAEATGDVEEEWSGRPTARVRTLEQLPDQPRYSFSLIGQYNSVSLSVYADGALKEGTYPIVRDTGPITTFPDGTVDGPDADTFEAAYRWDPQTVAGRYFTASAGEVIISSVNGNRIEGSFTFAGSYQMRVVSVTGTFTADVEPVEEND